MLLAHVIVSHLLLLSDILLVDKALVRHYLLLAVTIDGFLEQRLRIDGQIFQACLLAFIVFDVSLALEGLVEVRCILL